MKSVSREIKLIVCMALFTLIAIPTFAQYYKVTGNHVQIRKGPGTSYAKVMYIGEGMDMSHPTPAYLNKGNVVKARGTAKNGFLPIQPGPNCYGCSEGWVSMQYLTKAVKCSACNGEGTRDKVCSVCKGDGGECCIIGVGFRECKSCNGEGAR